MSPTATGSAKKIPGYPLVPQPDRRKHSRVQLKLLGRFMRENKQEYPCKLLNISPGGAALMAPIECRVDEHIICYIDNIGRIDGIVVRCFEGGFAIRISASEYKREKLANQLTWLVNQRALGIPDGRRHQRMVPQTTIQTLKLGDGTVIKCQILDVSLSGASVRLDVRPKVGTEVKLGRMRARVVRYHDSGVGLEFLDIQNPKAIKNYFQ